MNRLTLAVLAAATALSLTACDTEESKDSARTASDDQSPAQVAWMPDGFNNIATKCIPGTDIRVASIYHGTGASYSPYGAVAMVVDPDCRK